MSLRPVLPLSASSLATWAAIRPQLAQTCQPPLLYVSHRRPHCGRTRSGSCSGTCRRCARRGRPARRPTLRRIMRRCRPSATASGEADGEALA